MRNEGLQLETVYVWTQHTLAIDFRKSLYLWKYLLHLKTFCKVVIITRMENNEQTETKEETMKTTRKKLKIYLCLCQETSEISDGSI